MSASNRRGVDRGRKSSPSGPRRLRIIGGQWRGRHIDFAAVPGLRPTADRVRETVFNWLQGIVEGSRCLDLFAGSGALGFEAASRGAADVVMVESHPRVVEHLQSQAVRFGANQVEIVQVDALVYLRRALTPFDIVFLDPPFGGNLLNKACEALNENRLLKPDAHIYLEAEAHAGRPPIPAAWEIIRSHEAGQVGYHLAIEGAAS